MPENPILKAVEEATGLLDRMRIPYMIFGGIANSIYGNPRQTFDIDIKVYLESEGRMIGLLEALDRAGKIIPSDPAGFLEDPEILNRIMRWKNGGAL
jgi:hypothetical protein